MEESGFVHYLFQKSQRPSTIPSAMNISTCKEKLLQRHEARNMLDERQLTVPLLEGRSTTGVIETIVKLYCPDSDGGQG